jgi:hypothetical protein
MLLSKFLIKIFPRPDLRVAGSRWDHITRQGRPLMGVLLMVSRARSAVFEFDKNVLFNQFYHLVENGSSRIRIPKIFG